MSRTIRYLLLAVITAAPFNLSSSPLIKIGDSVDIYFTGRTGMRYESNIFLNASDKADDFIYTVQPGFEMVIGKQGIYGLTIKAYEDLEFYLDNQSLTNYRENVTVDAYYDSGAITKVSINGGYHPMVSNTGSENVQSALIRRRNYSLGINANFAISDKSTIMAGVNAVYDDYRNFIDLFGDNLVVDAPISYLYSISPVIQIGGGYRFRYTDFERLSTGLNLADRSDHFFNFQLNGELGAKLFNETSVGYQIRHVNGFDTTGDISLESVFTWEVAQKLQLRFGASRDFRSTGTGSSIKDTRGFFDIAYSVTDKIRLDFVSSYTQIGYETIDREDELSSAGVFCTYVINSYFNADFGYMYSNNHSTFDGIGGEPNASFNSHTVQVNASVKY